MTESPFGSSAWDSTPICVIARYEGSLDTRKVREALLAPQLNVKSVDVNNDVFSIVCKSRDAAVVVLQLLPELKLILETFRTV